MKKHRFAYFLRVHTGTIGRNKLVYIPIFVLMAIGLTLVFVLMSGFFTYYHHMQETIHSNSWNDVLVLCSELDRRAVSGGVTGEAYFEFLSNPDIRYEADAAAVITAEDLRMVEEALGDRLTLKALTSTPFYYRPSETDEEQYYVLHYVSRGLLGELQAKIDASAPYLIVDEGELPYLKRMGMPGACKQFPYTYRADVDAFFDMAGTPVALHFRDAFSSEELRMYSYWKSLEVDAEQAVIIAPLEAYFPVYFPMYSTELRVTSDDPQALVDFLAIMNTNHMGVNTYTYADIIKNELSAIYEQWAQFGILAPMVGMVLLMVGVLFSGMMYLTQRRRKRDIAIQIACGSSLRSAALGIVYTSLTTLTVAAVAAMVIGSLIIHKIHLTLNQILVLPTPEAGLVILGFSTVIGLLASIPSIAAINRISPAQTLSSEVVYD